jgi:FkbM family methyltransferase
MEGVMIRQGIPWRPLSFAAREVVVGQRTRIRLHPHLGEFDQAALFRRGLDYEKPVFAWLERNAVRRYQAIVEIGANVGVYSVFFDALIKDQPGGALRHVYVFEPSCRAYRRLTANLQANAAEFVSPFAVAISDKTGFSEFYEPEGHLTNGSLSREFAEHFSPSVRSSMVITLAGPLLADIFARHDRVLLKIDAEGSEPPILAAMAPILKQHAPDLLIEVLSGVEQQLQRMDELAAYSKLLLTSSGPSLRDALYADPADRDWLLTRHPQDIVGDEQVCSSVARVADPTGHAIR